MGALRFLYQSVRFGRNFDIGNTLTAVPSSLCATRSIEMKMTAVALVVPFRWTQHSSQHIATPNGDGNLASATPLSLTTPGPGRPSLISMMDCYRPCFKLHGGRSPPLVAPSPLTSPPGAPSFICLTRAYCVYLLVEDSSDRLCFSFLFSAALVATIYHSRLPVYTETLAILSGFRGCFGPTLTCFPPISSSEPSGSLNPP